MLLLKERQSGLGRQQFAKRIGMASSSYYELLSGQGNLQMATVATIAGNLGVSEWELIGVPEECLIPLPKLQDYS